MLIDKQLRYLEAKVGTYSSTQIKLYLAPGDVSYRHFAE